MTCLVNQKRREMLGGLGIKHSRFLSCSCVWNLGGLARLRCNLSLMNNFYALMPT